MKVHLWDEVGGSWSDVSITDDIGNIGRNLNVHHLVCESLEITDPEPWDGDKILYRVASQNLSFNIGRWGREMMYIEMWGPRAQAVRELAEAEQSWYPNTPREAMKLIVDLEGVVSRAVGD